MKQRTQLTQLATNEISLVPNGANQKRFLVLKEDEPTGLMARILKSFGKKDDDDQINEQLDGLTPAAQTAARAIARIAAPHADELQASHLGAVLSTVGIDGVGGKKKSGGSNMKVKDDDKKAAKSAAENAYKSHMEKLGYKKYPTAELTMKAFGDEEEEDDDEDMKAKKLKAKKEQEDADAEKAKKEKAKMEKEQLAKVFREDGSIDLTAISKEDSPELYAIAKMVQASDSRARAAELKANTSETVLKEHKESVRKEEIIRKSFEFRNLNQKDVEATLVLADKAGTEEYTRVVKMFEAQNVQIGQGGLFGEIGKSGMSDGSLSAWAKIDKAADSVVQKSSEGGTKISKEQAITNFLETEEGQNLYAQHQASRPNGI